MKKINVGIIGLGTVGLGVLKILRERRNILSEKIGVDIVLKRACDVKLRPDLKTYLPKGSFTTSAEEVIGDPQIDIVVELIGGIHPAKEYITTALAKGKHVVTANKALLAEEGRELFALAQDRSKNISFEASVGAGIPVVKALREGLVANRFDSIFGILNGTSNYILTQMSKHGWGFPEALKSAQKNGYAEKDPTLDIEGKDSAHKLVLLTYLAFGRLVDLEDVFVEGISRVSGLDVLYARELGFEIKLMAVAKKDKDNLELRVEPVFIPAGHLLASVDGVFNAIYVNSDKAGSLLFYGPGAGQLSAASAVVSDLVDLAQDVRAGLFRPNLKIVPDNSVSQLRKIQEVEGRYYIRFMAVDRPGVLARISGVLARFDISIASVTQKERSKQEVVPIVMVIHETKYKFLHSALEVISRLDVIKEKPVCIRIEQI